ncbi:DUF4190 domain-containing protein [Sphaerisporangium perillae]|uniref:DUF4190 domain-containing protein n=1 Tax=Sphaerisporangium perillae TaxID=2935860 RepID=UPI00200CA8C0|nr:DUF4190 domain-containing protein [Sphaerisporangium perillae]
MNQQSYGYGQPPCPRQQYGGPPGQQYPLQQPYGYQQPMPMMALPEPRNGLGLAALICAIIGCLCGFVPIAFILGGPLAVVAIARGIAGMGRVRRGVATNSRTTNIGVVPGILALIMAFNGACITFTVVNEFGKTVNGISRDNQQCLDCVKKAPTQDESWPAPSSLSGDGQLRGEDQPRVVLGVLLGTVTHLPGVMPQAYYRTGESG